MDLQQLLRHRRMVRHYQDRPVPRELLEEILDLARRAPSAGFSQGQRFLVIQDPAQRTRLATLAGEGSYRERGFDPWLSRAPVHVVLAADMQAYHLRYAEWDKKSSTSSQEWQVPYWHIDAGASLMLLLLAATERGMAAGFLGEHNLPGLAAALELPAKWQAIGLITLGYGAPDRPSGSLKRGRLAAEEQVFWEYFSPPL